MLDSIVSLDPNTPGMRFEDLFKLLIISMNRPQLGLSLDSGCLERGYGL